MINTIFLFTFFKVLAIAIASYLYIIPNGIIIMVKKSETEKMMREVDEKLSIKELGPK